MFIRPTPPLFVRPLPSSILVKHSEHQNPDSHALIDEMYYKVHELSVDRRSCWLLGSASSVEDGLERFNELEDVTAPSM